MNLPELSINFFKLACFLIKNSGGIIHFYQFCDKPKPTEKAIKNIKTKVQSLICEIQDIMLTKIVKNYSPKTDLIVVDFSIKST